MVPGYTAGGRGAACSGSQDQAWGCSLLRASWRSVDRRHPSWKRQQLRDLADKAGWAGAPGQARNKRVTKRSQEWAFLEVGAADKDALKVQLVGDRIFVAEPVTYAPCGWMRPDRQISKLAADREATYHWRPLRGLALPSCPPLFWSLSPLCRCKN